MAYCLCFMHSQRASAVRICCNIVYMQGGSFNQSPISDSAILVFTCIFGTERLVLLYVFNRKTCERRGKHFRTIKENQTSPFKKSGNIGRYAVYAACCSCFKGELPRYPNRNFGRTLDETAVRTLARYRYCSF